MLIEEGRYSKPKISPASLIVLPHYGKKTLWKVYKDGVLWAVLQTRDAADRFTMQACQPN